MDCLTKSSLLFHLVKPLLKRKCDLWHALFQVNPNWLLVIKCFFPKWSQTICLIGNWHSARWFAIPRIHSKPLLPTHTCTRTTYNSSEIGKAVVLSSQNYRHWSHLQVIFMSPDVILEPRHKSQLKEVLTDSLYVIELHLLSKLCLFYFCNLKIFFINGRFLLKVESFCHLSWLTFYHLPLKVNPSLPCTCSESNLKIAILFSILYWLCPGFLHPSAKGLHYSSLWKSHHK